MECVFFKNAIQMRISGQCVSGLIQTYFTFGGNVIAARHYWCMRNADAEFSFQICPAFVCVEQEQEAIESLKR